LQLKWDNPRPKRLHGIISEEIWYYRLKGSSHSDGTESKIRTGTVYYFSEKNNIFQGKIIYSLEI